jgi:hypothetical protein
MKKTLLGLTAAAIILVPLAGQTLASSYSTTDASKLSEALITEMLAKEGYKVIRVEREEHGKIEVKATQGSELWELKLDPATGKILKKERED